MLNKIFHPNIGAQAVEAAGGVSPLIWSNNNSAQMGL